MARHKARFTKIRLRIELLENRWVPTTITPTTFADGGLGSGSLRDAILQFNADTGTDDDIIQLEAGTYSLTIQNVGGHHETAGLTGDLNLTQTSHRWIIQGAGPGTIIDASQLQDRVLQIVNPGTQVVFQDLVIQGGLAQDDGSDGALAGTTDALGGGILNNGGDVRLDNVVVENNVARGGTNFDGYNARGGGLYSTGGSLDISRSTIFSNQAAAGGGAAGSHTTGSGTTGGGSGGSAQGGGVYVNGSSLTIASSAIASNQGTGGSPGGWRGLAGVGLGGGLYNAGTLTVSGSTVSGNTASYGVGGNGGAGGGIYNFGTLTVSESTLSGNTASEYLDGGGAIYNLGTLTVSNSTVSDNRAGAGGGIYNYSGTLSVSESTLSGNSAYNGGAIICHGGGIYNYSGTVTVSASTLSGNSAFSYFGGGIYNYSGTLTVSNSTLSGNSAHQGGGIHNSGTLTISDSALTGNSASYGGGIEDYGTLTVSNSTLSGNSAVGNGGGMYLYNTIGVTLTNVTLTANRANTFGGSNYPGGGLYSYSSSAPVLHNTLIAGNFRNATGTNPDDVYGPLDPGGDYNLIGDGTGMSGLSDGVNGNQIGSADAPIDPLLGPLQDNGGSTLTHALLLGSPALDAGNNAYATDWDQRGEGFPRIVNGIIDIGAFEYQGDGFGPSVPGEDGREALTGAALVWGLPVHSFSATVTGAAPIPSATRGNAPSPELQSGLNATSVDPLSASVTEKAPVAMAARWPDQELVPSGWSNPDLFWQEAGPAL